MFRTCLIQTGLLVLILGAVNMNVQARPVEVDPVLRDRLAYNLAENHEHLDRFDAQVWLQVSDQRLQRYLPSQRERLDLLHLVYRESSRQNLDPDLVLAVMQIESAFNRFAISRVGAQGLMQVMPFWRLEIGRPQDNLTHVETNIRYGTVILAHYIDVAEGDLVDALARYNGSRGRLKYPEKVIAAWRKTWRNKTRDELPSLQASCAAYGLRACRYQ
jgi:soluble lytic murein transglycosylase-like protein